MPAQAARRALLPLLDRLIDEAPERAHDAPTGAGEAMEQLRRAVRRDLEMLLNARRRWRSWAAEWRELSRSSLAFGIPDCTAGMFHDKRRREDLRQEIETTLRRFEPRFLSVRVRLLESPNPLDTTLRLQIEAMLCADPAPEPIAFATVFDATTVEVAVRETDA